MPDEGFLRRWARLKADGPAVADPAAAPAGAELRSPPAAPVVAPFAPRADAVSRPVLPTLDDVAKLDASSDFSAFVSKGVDKDVRRLAMKKLFSDPHFNLVDKLDVYMDDYNKPSPMSAEMRAALHHTKNLFAPLAADKEAEPEAEVAAVAGDETTVTAAEGDGEGAPASAANPDREAAVTADTIDPDDDTIPVLTDPIPFYGAAPGGVLQQTQQGNA